MYEYISKEELEAELPLGTVVASQPIFQRFYCADEITFEKIKNWFKGSKVEQTSPHHVTVSRMDQIRIEGYLYDGEQWLPMIRNGRNWEVYLPEIF